MNEEEQKNVERLADELRARSSGVVFAESFWIFIINLTSLIGNVLVCYVFYKKPALRTITNVYVGALATSDVLMAVLVMPWTVGIFINGRWVFGNAACQFQGFMVLLLAWLSLHTMTLTAVNRYCRVVRPNTYRKWFSVKSSIIMIIVTLVIIIVVIATPLTAGWCHFTFRPGKSMCFMTFNQSFNTTRRVYIATVVVIYTVVPMVTIFICYYKIFRKVNKHRTAVNPALQNISEFPFVTMSVREVRVTRTLFCMLIGFLVCWIPVIIVEMMNSFLGTASLSRAAYLCYLYFAFISCATNPIIYAVTNKIFRKEFLSVLPCRIHNLDLNHINLNETALPIVQ